MPPGFARPFCSRPETSPSPLAFFTSAFTNAGGSESSEQLGDCRRGVRIRDDHTLVAGASAFRYLLERSLGRAGTRQMGLDVELASTGFVASRVFHFCSDEPKVSSLSPSPTRRDAFAETEAAGRGNQTASYAQVGWSKECL
jgi:hypothetical protein